MSEKTDSNERKLSGTTRLFTGFVIGALFALAPMYYFYMGREAAVRGGPPAVEPRVAPAEPPGEAPAATERRTPPFASRLTYELSRLPEEPLPVVARAPSPAVSPAPSGSSAIASNAELPSATRVTDARPISARPPDPRDRTRAIEQEAQKAEYREPQRDAVSVRPPKVFEGREVELSARKLPATPTKPIAGSGLGGARGEAAGVAVAGVSPITRPPDTSAAPEKSVEAVPEAPAGRGAPASVESRLAATRVWLDAAAKTTHTIQLMGASSEAQLDAQLKSLGKMLEPERLYVYRTIAQGKPSITVVYGEYSDRKSALQALDRLPPALVANKPVLRTVNGIRAEMKQHKTDGLNGGA